MPDKPSGEQLDKIADTLDRAQDIGLDVIQGSIPPGRDARLDELLKQCSEKGWDSYTAEPLNQETVDLVKKLFPAVQALNQFTMVSIVPCPTGGLQLEGDTLDGKRFEIQVWVDPEE